MSATPKPKGSIVSGALWMLLLSALLFWLPLIGPLFAGFIGGKKSGGVLAAIAAVFLPGLVMGIGLFLLASALSGMPLVGLVASLGGLAFALSHVGPLLVGAVIGGLLG